MLRVVQLNIGSLLEPHWDQRRVEIVHWLDELEPDVVCVQEAWERDGQENTAAWLADHAAGTWHLAFSGERFRDRADDDVRFGVAVLSRWPIDTHRRTTLPVGPEPDAMVTNMPFGLLHVETAGLDVFVTHLAPAPTHALHRRAQVLAIDEHIRAARGDRDVQPRRGRRDGMPAILCGDFNAEPDSDEIRFLCGLTPLDGRVTFFQDAWRIAGDGGPGYTQDWRTHPIAASLNVHRKRIDYVFVGDPFLRRGGAGRVLSAKVVFDEPRTGIQASDHMGLVVEIEWPDRPDAGFGDATRPEVAP